MMVLDPVAVVNGQWWRLFTYIFVPSTGALNMILAIFWFQFLWMIGQALEAQWGSFRLTLYVLSGVFFGAFVSMAGFLFLHLPILQSGSYWSLSMLLAFACLHPEVEMLVMFILPLKMRWAAWIIGAYLLYQVVSGGFPALFEVAGSMANFILFFGPMAWRRFRDRKSSLAAQSEPSRSFPCARLRPACRPRACKSYAARGVAEADLRLQASVIAAVKTGCFGAWST